jgi:hypothetical protein
VGGFDVLIDINNKAYLIDCNFRMTGMSAYHFMLKNKQLTVPFITLSGSFKGTEDELLRSFSHFYNYSSGRRFLQLITLSKKDNEWHFNASLSYKDREQLLERTRLILNTGIQSATLLHIDQV